MNTHKNVKVLKWMKRPVPHADESLAGFLGRWARENVLSSRTNLLNTIGVSRAIRTFPADLERLSKSLGIALSVLESMAPSTDPSLPVLRRSHTRPTTEAVCPRCLAEASYSRQLWSHAFATACPLHESRLLDQCQQCGNGIRHDRPLPHICDCGADLRKQVSALATPAEVEFSHLLMGNKPKAATFPFILHNGVPAEFDLFAWGLANQFGDTVNRNKVGKTPLPKSVSQALAKLLPTFELFENWPVKFDTRLDQMLADTPKGLSTGAAARAGRWYFFLFRKYHHLEAFLPLRVATANAIVKSHDGLLNSRTSSVIAISTVRKNWYSVMEASVELRVSAGRINDGIDRCLIGAQVHDEAVGYRQRFIALDEIERLKQLQFEHIDDTEARALLQVPNSVYSLMCDAGWITRADKNDVAPVVTGYIQHVPLLALIERIRTSAQLCTDTHAGTSVRLRNLNLRRTTDHQRLISLFRAIASGEIVPVAHDESFTIGGMLFSQGAVDKRIASWFVARGLTVEQISGLTGAHYDAVKAWVDMGLLPATREVLEHGSPWIIDLRDFTTFLQTYSPLAFQAKSCDSTTRGLTARLAKIGVTTIDPPGSRGALLKLTDLWHGMKVEPAIAP